MKRYLGLLLALLLVFSLVACKTDTTPPVVDTPPVEESPVVDPPPVETPDEPEVPEEPAEVDYAPYAIQFKNKTGVTITGLYLYETGAEDKGASLCPAVWPDAEADKPASTIITYVVRAKDSTCELYVEWEDGTNATLSDLTLIERDKFSMKGGVDPAGWEHEPMDDAEEIAEADALVAAGKTTDNFYGNYVKIGVEFKNKTGKDIAELYFYEEGAEPTKYNNMVEHAVYFNEDRTESFPLSNPWEAGKGGEYVHSYFIRPVSGYYEVYVVFSDGATLTIPELDMLTANAEGFTPNKLSMKSADDPFGTVPAYDDGDPEPVQYLAEAMSFAPSADEWYPTF
ncbi:hypothetical protein LJC07_04120 [Christensenellaceae bacterium OttesenSCG-928-L17]|nr:hypothetical protein [Christensenellaceae bacterium OttesenSCG-928-L17]